ncbi:MAG: AraC family transcriptional regulator [Treponema sp.]|jgi:AraC-like DNA-binding protein|nr:AraC family transcriptional regulator [Treponema sp.]
MRIKDAVYVYKLVGGDKLAWHGRYHAHDRGEYEIHLFLEGSGAFLLNRSKYTIEGNCLFLTKPREFHSILPDAVRRPLSYYALLFEPDLEITADRESASLINDHNDRIINTESRERFLIEELYRLAADRDHARAAEYLLLSLLYRWYGESVQEGAGMRREQDDRNEYVEWALAFMGKSVQEKLRIDSLANRLGLSEEHFIRLFHKKLGMSPLQYFTRLKIEAASSFIVDTNRTIGSVAAHFGFENPFHFSRIFKKCTGLSPMEYRRVFGPRGREVNEE